MRNVLAAHPSHWRPSAATTRRTTNPQGGRSQQVILISVRTSAKCARPIFPKWEPGQGSKGGSGIPWAILLGIIPAPLMWSWRRIRWRKDHSPTQHIPITSVFPHLDQTAAVFCKPRIVYGGLPKMLHFTNVKHIKS